MKWPLFALLTGFAAALSWSGVRSPEIPFEKVAIDLGAAETCAFTDINGDGRLDIVSGEHWYEAPKWTPHKFRDLPYSNNYMDAFSDLPLDVDGDGRTDIATVAWFGRKVNWFRNGPTTGNWPEQVIESGFNVEFAFLADLDNDGKAREILPQFGNENAPLAWYEARNGAFVRRIVASKSQGHGIGAGDVNGDKRNDVVTPKGWYEAPADPRTSEWTFHPDFDLGSTGFIHVFDVNSDGRNDLVTSLAHDYGIFWMERTASGQWKKNLIDESWSQAHALVLTDLNGDGRMDLLTGKRYMAHNGKDPGEREPLGLYWYEYRLSNSGNVEWIRHVIDYSTRAGGGMQIAVADIDEDGDLDFAAGGKSGLFLFLNRTR
jgi:hypothetical protein